MQIHNQIRHGVIFGTQLRIELTRSDGFDSVVVRGMPLMLQQLAPDKLSIEIRIDKAAILLKGFRIGHNRLQLQRRKSPFQIGALFGLVQVVHAPNARVFIAVRSSRNHHVAQNVSIVVVVVAGSG